MSSAPVPMVQAVQRQRRSQEDTTVEHAAIRGLAPTGRVSVGCLPQSRPAGACRSLHAVEGDTIRGLRPVRWDALLRCSRTSWAFEGIRGTALALVHRQAISSLAMATTT